MGNDESFHVPVHSSLEMLCDLFISGVVGRPDHPNRAGTQRGVPRYLGDVSRQSHGRRS
jgi:hypothetical protein